jgi:hypothetical protein
MWKRSLWPDVRNEIDADAASRRGFWLCMALSVLTLLPGLVGAEKSAVLKGAAFLFTAAMGVRNRSWVAAAAVLTVYAGERLLLLRLGGNPGGLVPFLITALLAANVRGAWLAARFPVVATPEAESLPDWFADVFAVRAWRYARWLFWPLAVWLGFGLTSMLAGAET